MNIIKKLMIFNVRDSQTLHTKLDFLNEDKLLTIMFGNTVGSLIWNLSLSCIAIGLIIGISL